MGTERGTKAPRSCLETGPTGRIRRSRDVSWDNDRGEAGRSKTSDPGIPTVSNDMIGKLALYMLSEQHALKRV